MRMWKIIIIIIGILVLILVVGFIILREKPEQDQISFEERQLIGVWIKENDLNQYGDPKDIVYTGGTPLFNEMTGERIDKYEYILKNHPDRPWLE